MFSVAADGLLRGLIPDTGDLALAPARFLPANATATGLIWADGFVYAATSNTCGGAPKAVYAMDFMAENKPVTTVGVRRRRRSPASRSGRDGTMYVVDRRRQRLSTRTPSSRSTRKTLKLKDWIRHRATAFISTPVVFKEGSRTYVAATTGSRLYLLDAASLGGTDHQTPLFATPEAANVRFSDDGIATWRRQRRARWILAAVSSAIAAFKLVDNGSAPVAPAGVDLHEIWRRLARRLSSTAWCLRWRRQASSANAVLYALDPATGKELWNSGTTITSAASAGLSAGTGQVLRGHCGQHCLGVRHSSGDQLRRAA